VSGPASMNRAEQLAARRMQLLARGAEQRTAMLQEHDAIVARLQGVDRGIEWIKRALDHPLLILGAVSALIAIGPFKIMRWMMHGAFWFRLAQKAGGYLMSPSRDAVNRSSDDGSL
jgi:hypothetical protein